MDMIEFLQKIPNKLRPQIIYFVDKGFILDANNYGFVRKIYVVTDKSIDDSNIHSIDKIITLREINQSKVPFLLLQSFEDEMVIELIDYLKDSL